MEVFFKMVTLNGKNFHFLMLIFLIIITITLCLVFIKVHTCQTSLPSHPQRILTLAMNVFYLYISNNLAFSDYFYFSHESEP